MRRPDSSPLHLGAPTINTTAPQRIIALIILTLSLGIGWRAWAVVSGHYHDQVVLSGFLSQIPQTLRLMSNGSCVGVLASRYGEESPGGAEQTFDGGGNVRLRWRGRDIVVGGAYHLATNMINQLYDIEARLGALGFFVRARIVGTDRYRGSVSIFAGEQQIQSIPIDVPGPLSVSERAGGVFDVVAPIRSFRQSRSILIDRVVSIEPGTCNPTGSLDLDKLLERIPAAFPQHGLPLSIPFQQPGRP